MGADRTGSTCLEAPVPFLFHSRVVSSNKTECVSHVLSEGDCDSSLHSETLQRKMPLPPRSLASSPPCLRSTSSRLNSTIQQQTCQHLDDDSAMAEVHVRKEPHAQSCAFEEPHICPPRIRVCTSQGASSDRNDIPRHRPAWQFRHTNGNGTSAFSESPLLHLTPRLHRPCCRRGSQLTRYVPLYLHRQHRRLPKPRSLWRRPREG